MQELWKGHNISSYPTGIVMTFYWKDLRRHDLDNGVATILDALKDAGVIEDDDFKHINSVEARYGGHDKENPRCEIRIYE
jgi:Holliday junction resolvase RusA-like endonuclease